MSSKTIPFSVRLSPENSKFINELEVVEAKTPSDKIRAIITKARLEKELAPKMDYKDFLGKITTLFEPVLLEYRECELKNNLYSELVCALIEWTTEVTAFILASKNLDKDNKNRLKMLEKGLVDRIFKIFELVLRMGVTTHAPCYDKNIIRDNLNQVLELTELISKNKE